MRYLFLLLLLSACTPPPSKPYLRKISFNQLPGWKTDALQGSLQALLQTCNAFEKKPLDTPIGWGLSTNNFKALCAAARTCKNPRRFFETHFKPHKICYDATKCEGLFTGYFELELEASLEPSPEHRHPLYKRPKDLTRKFINGKTSYVRHYNGRHMRHFSRTQIHDGALSTRNLELAYAKDPIDLFFLHIQGSGRIRLPSGKVLRVGYDGANGHPYTSIGKILAEREIIPLDRISMQSIKQWLKENPEDAVEILHHNQSFVFFRLLDSDLDGPIGSLGVPLTPIRSLAVDKQFIPLGLPLWLDAAHGDNAFNIRCLVMAQDTGGAIKGIVRGDLFWGAGKKAEYYAGHMKSKGYVYALIPKNATLSTHDIALG